MPQESWKLTTLKPVGKFLVCAHQNLASAKRKETLTTNFSLGSERNGTNQQPDFSWCCQRYWFLSCQNLNTDRKGAPRWGPLRERQPKWFVLALEHAVPKIDLTWSSRTMAYCRKRGCSIAGRHQGEHLSRHKQPLQLGDCMHKPREETNPENA